MAMSLILAARRTASLCLVRKGQASLGHSKLVTRPSNSFLPHAAVAPTYLISKSSFHTSKIRPAVPQILIALLKPMSRLAVMIIGRRFRKWRKNLDDEQKEQIRAKTHKYSHLLGGTVTQYYVVTGVGSSSGTLHKTSGSLNISVIIYPKWLKLGHP